MRTQTSQKAELFARALRKVFLGVFAVCVCIVVSSLVRPDLTAAATSNTINFQARLETNAGAIVPDGNYNVEFKLYSVATLGSAEWTEDYTYNSGPGSTDVRLRVANGYLTANLGSITAFPGTINWNQQQWLTMNIGGTVSSGPITWDGEMSPRLQLTAVPYAFAAGALSTTDGSGNTGTLSFGTVTNNPVITLPNASGTVCLQSSSACGFATGSGTAFLQGGNSFGAQGVLGTNDSNSLAIRTNNTNKLVIDTSGNLQLQQASTFNIASASGGSQLTIQAGANSTAAGTGGTLLLQGGAPGTTGASGSVIVKANTNDSTTAFEVQNAAGTSTVLNVDTKNLILSVNGDIADTFNATPGLTQTSLTTTTATAPAGATNPVSVAVQGKYAYVVESGSSGKLQIFDVTNVGTPESVSVTSLNQTSPIQIQVQGHYAYIAEQGASNGKLEIFDISNPKSPTSVAAVAPAGSGSAPQGVYVSGRYAYLTDSGNNNLVVYDISNPTSPVVLSTTATNAGGPAACTGSNADGNSPRKVYVQGRYAYVASAGSSTGRLGIFDMNNPAAPALVGCKNANAGINAMSVYVEGRYAYMTEYASLLRVVDVSDPTNPTTLTTLATDNGLTYQITGAGRYVFTSGDTAANRVDITDIANPGSPSDLQSYSTNVNDPRGMFFDGRYLYVANNGGNTLQILDVTGLEVTAATIHSLEAGNLSVDTNSYIGGDASIQGGLTVGGAAQVNDNLGVSGTAEFVSNTNSTKAFQVQNSSGANLLTVDTSNTAIVLGNDATPAALTVRGGAASGTNVAGANITFDASNGTGSAASGDILFRTAAPNAAAVASGDHTEFEGYNQASLSTTFNVTSHSNMVMVVGVNQQDSTQTATSISWNGSTAGWTKIGSQTNAAGGVVELWYLVAPTSGSHTLQVNLLNTSGNNHQFAAAATFYNVNQTTPIGNSNTASGTGTSTSVTVNSSVNQDVVDVVGNNSFCLGTPGSGQTRIWADTLGPNTIFGGSYKTAVAGTTTMTWSQTSSCGWETVAASLNLVSGTTADTLTDRLHITADGNVGIDNANPQYALDVSGSGNFNTSVLSPILDTATAVALNIGTTNASSINLGNVTSNIQTTINGTVLIKPTSGHDSSTAFQVQTASGSSVLTVDTSNTRVGIGINIPSNTFSASPLDYATGTVCSTATAGGVTCSGTSTTFLLGGGTTWAASMIGDTVVFADGTVKTITAFTDGNHVTLSGAVNEGPAATYKFYHTGLQVTSAGNTYIQNTSTTALQVQNGAGSALLAVDTVNTQVQVTGDTSGAAVGPLVVRSTSSGSSIGAALTVDASPASGGHSWSFLSTGPGAGTGAGYFGFYDGTSSAYRMVINPSGYVGINTVNPQTVLDVVGETTMEASGTGITGAVALVKGNADGNAVGPLVVKALDANGVGAALTLDSTVSTGGHSWSFLATGAGAAAGAGSFSYYDGTAGAYRLTVGPTGNVGIGITAPTNLFSVSPQDAYGSATRTNGSATIVGSGTGWSNAQVGDVIDFSGGYTNTVVSVADATHLTVASSYGGTTDGSPVSFVLYKPGFNATSSGTAYIQGNSTNEFQIQAAGTAGTGSVLNVDTTNTMLSFNGGQNGAVGAFTTSANTMPAVMYQTSTTVSNGYIYAMGGSDSSLTENSHVYYAQLNGDGSIGSWQTDANSLPATSRAAHGVSYNGYLYYVGGVSGGSSLNTVYYAKQNKDGSTGTWSATTALPNTVGNMGVVISNGYLYSIGSRDTPYTNVYYGKINDDGSIGSWTSGTSLPAGRWAQLSVVANGHIYSIAGYDGSGTQQSTVYDAPLNTDGSLGSWTTTTSLPVVMNYVEGGVANGYVYVVGGNGPGAVAVNTIYYAKMNADGTLGSWATNTNTLPQTNDGPGVVLANGYIYVVGGGVWSTSAFNTLEYASTARLSVSGSLDLVGLTTGQLTSQSSTGGSIYAGSIYSVGNLTVQGNSQLGAGLGVGGVLAATGDVLLQDATNSTTAFKIQNATGSIALLAADTTNNRITLGSGSGSNVTILVLGSKSDAGDPTGVNGAMYYNANLGKFRCYQSSAWVNCAGGTASEFGDGSDGSLTFDGTTTILGMVPSSSTYTLTRDIYGVNITVNSGVTILASGFRIFATGTFTNNGTVSANGGNGTNASAGTNGQGGTTPVGFYQSGGTGGQGGGGIAGSQGGTTTYGQLGGNGGTGGTNTNAGGAGGSSQPTAAEGGLQAIKVYSVAVTGELQYLTGISTMAMIGGGGGGGGGGSSSTANRGGGGGGGGGVIFIAALSIVNNGTISANGGNGGNGNGSGGVGGGGGGGLVMTFSSSYSGSAGTATAGTKGTTGSTTSATDGSAGLVLQESI